MKSQVEHYLTFDEILLPEPYITVEIPSWEAVIAPVLKGVLAFYNEQFKTSETALTDEMIQALNHPNFKSLHEIKQFAIEAFQEREKEKKFQFEIFPYLLVFFDNTTQTIINEEEFNAYYQAMIENYHEDAEKGGISYEQFIQNSFGLTLEQTDELTERIHEYFVYKLIANERFKVDGKRLDEASYDAFVQDQVMTLGHDEIDVRERLPFVVYQDIYPEILLTEELKVYFKEQITFKISESNA